MANYIGTKCMSCGEAFTDKDDVVVCPICGTPYHRNCYIKEGDCINYELHEKSEAWQPVYDGLEDEVKEDFGTEPVRCIRCGEENPPTQIFCGKCGMPLNQKDTTTQRPFNDAYKTNEAQQGDNKQAGGFTPPPMGMMGNPSVMNKDTLIDDITVDDYAKFVGGNPLYWLSNFLKFSKIKTKVSLNFGALLFPQFYCLYRKMYGLGILALIISFVFSIPNLIYNGSQELLGQVFITANINLKSTEFTTLYSIASYGFWIVRCLMALFINYLYFKNAKKKITEARGIDGDEETIKMNIASKGGVSWINVIIGFTLFLALSTLSIFLVNKLM